MPRPSLKDVRSHDILDAFVTCVAKFGLEGATQERIAAEAGVKRTLLRHYLGNREEMVASLIMHVVSEFERLVEQFQKHLEGSESVMDLVDMLFEARSPTDPRLIMAYQALVVSIEAYPGERETLLSSTNNFIALIAGEIKKFQGSRSYEECEAIAHGLAALHTNYDTLSKLDPPPQWRTASKRAAIMLVSSQGDAIHA